MRRHPCGAVLSVGSFRAETNASAKLGSVSTTAFSLPAVRITLVPDQLSNLKPKGIGIQQRRCPPSFASGLN